MAMGVRVATTLNVIRFQPKLLLLISELISVSSDVFAHSVALRSWLTASLESSLQRFLRAALRSVFFIGLGKQLHYVF